MNLRWTVSHVKNAVRKSHPSKIVGEGSGFIATMEDMVELDIPAAGMYKLGEEIVQGSEKLKVLEISGKGPGGWARTLTRESGPGSAKVVRVRGRKPQ